MEKGDGFLEAAVETLPPSSYLARAISHELHAISVPGGFDDTGFTEVHLLDAVSRVWEFNLASGPVKLAFGSDGSLVHLSGSTGKPWASAHSPLAQLLYQGLNKSMISRFITDYSAGAEVSPWNFDKPNLPATLAFRSVSATPKLTRFQMRQQVRSSGRAAAGSAGMHAAEFLLS